MRLSQRWIWIIVILAGLAVLPLLGMIAMMLMGGATMSDMMSGSMSMTWGLLWMVLVAALLILYASGEPHLSTRSGASQDGHQIGCAPILLFPAPRQESSPARPFHKV